MVDIGASVLARLKNKATSNRPRPSLALPTGDASLSLIPRNYYPEKRVLAKGFYLYNSGYEKDANCFCERPRRL